MTSHRSRQGNLCAARTEQSLVFDGKQALMIQSWCLGGGLASTHSQVRSRANVDTRIEHDGTFPHAAGHIVGVGSAFVDWAYAISTVAS